MYIVTVDRNVILSKLQSKTDFWDNFDIDSLKLMQPVIAWCNENIEDDTWSWPSYFRFGFVREDDAIYFKLIWG